MVLLVPEDHQAFCLTKENIMHPINYEHSWQISVIEYNKGKHNLFIKKCDLKEKKPIQFHFLCLWLFFLVIDKNVILKKKAIVHFHFFCMWLFLLVPWVGLRCVIVVFTDYTDLLSNNWDIAPKHERRTVISI